MARIHKTIYCPHCNVAIVIPKYENVIPGVYGDAYSGDRHVDCECDESRKVRQEIWEKISQKLNEK